MTCYYPLHAYKGKSQEANKIKIAFKRTESWRAETIDLPCGQCIGCRLERARQWAVRCVHEASLYEKNSFLTLTYDDYNLPDNGSLVLSHFQEFIKKLRRESDEKIRYFHCGEYGEELGRPHYHAIVFNWEPQDKEYWCTKNGNKLYISKNLSKLWTKGHSLVGAVTKESAGYVARYALKKVTGDKAEIYYGLKKPEYCSMSRRPGIGNGWYKKFGETDVHEMDRIWMEGQFGKPPRYYDEILKKLDPKKLEMLKKQRQKEAGKKLCSDVYLGKFIIESDSTDRRLIEKAKTKEAEIKMLRREL